MATNVSLQYVQYAQYKIITASEAGMNIYIWGFSLCMYVWLIERESEGVRERETETEWQT